MHASENQPAGDWNRSAFAHRKGETAERSPRDLESDRQSGNPLEHPIRDVYGHRGRDRRSEQDERERLDDDRGEDEDQGLDSVDLAEPGSSSCDRHHACRDHHSSGDDERHPLWLEAIRIGFRGQRDRTTSAPPASRNAAAAKRTIVPPGGKSA